jgi:hypothetical protein
VEPLGGTAVELLSVTSCALGVRRARAGS